MATFAPANFLGSSASKTANQASRAHTTTAAAAAGEYVVALLAVDNSSTTVGVDEGAVTGVTDSAGGNAWAKLREWCNGAGAAQGGATISAWGSLLTNGIPSGGTITFALSNSASRDASIVSAQAFYCGATVTVEATNTAVATGAAAGSLDATTANKECLRIRASAYELPVSAAAFSGTIAQTSGWTALYNTVDSGVSTSTSGGSGVTNMTLRGEYRISTGTSDASSPSWLVADNASIYVALSSSTQIVATADAWNKTDKTVGVSLSNNDKTATSNDTTTTAYGVRSTTTHDNETAGKFYAEFTAAAYSPESFPFGIKATSAVLTNTTVACIVSPISGGIFLNGSTVSGMALGAAADGDVFCVAWDAGAQKVWLRRNAGIWNGVAGDDPATGTGGIDASSWPAEPVAVWVMLQAAGAVGANLRTELAEFTQAVPSGFASWMGEGGGPTGYTETVTAGEVPITGATVSPVYAGQIAYTETVTAGAVPITGGTIADVLARFEPAITAGALPIDGQAVTDVLARFEPAITPASLPISGAAITDVFARFEPAITPAAIPITGGTIAPLRDYTDTITPAAVPIAGASVAETAAYLESLTAAALPIAGQTVTPAYGAGGIDYVETVSPGDVPITGGTVADVLARFEPAVTAAALPIAGQTVADVLARFEPAITPAALPIAGGTTADVLARFEPAVTAGALPITGAAIADRADYLESIAASALPITGQAVTPLFSAGGINYTETIIEGSVPIGGGTIGDILARIEPAVTAGVLPIVGSAIIDVRGRVDTVTPASVPIVGATITDVLARFEPAVTASVVPITGATIFPFKSGGYIETIVAGAVPITGSAITDRVAYRETITLSLVPISGATVIPVFTPGAVVSNVWVKHAGVWKRAIPWVKHGGTWKPADVHVKHAGTWKQVA